MAAKEIKIAYRVFAILGTLIVVAVITGYAVLKIRAPHLFVLSDSIYTEVVRLRQDELPGLVFHGGIEGCENLLLDGSTMRVWVSDLRGNISELDAADRAGLRVVKRNRIGEMVLGLARDPDGNIFAGVSGYKYEGWIEQGGKIALLDTSLKIREYITGGYPSLNGVTSDEAGGVYFVSGNFDPLKPEGRVYLAVPGDEGGWAKPVVAIDSAGMANGLFFDPGSGRIYFSSSVTGVFSFLPGENTFRPEYVKSSFLEFVDDLCLDGNGNIWMTDPGGSTLKVLLADQNKLIRFVVRGIGQTSSCRIRIEEGKEIIYVTELNQKQKPRSQAHDGRGIFSVPVGELLSHIKLPEPV